MMQRLSTMCPTIGGVWEPSLRWAFIQNFHLFKTTLPKDRFFNGILTSWSVKNISISENAFDNGLLVETTFDLEFSLL